MDKMLEQIKLATTSVVITKRDLWDLAFSAGGFFIGRAMIFGSINPIVIAYLATFLFSGPRFYMALVFAGLGLVTKFSSIYSIKYYMCLGLLFLSGVTLKNRVRNKSLLLPIIGGTSIFLSGVILSITYGFSAFLLVMAALEGGLAALLTFIIGKGLGVIDHGEKARYAEEMIGIAIIGAGIIAGSADIHIGIVSMRMVFAPLFVLVCALRGGYGAGCAGGLLTGLVLQFTGLESPEFTLILAASGMVSGSLNHTKKIYMVAGFFATFFPLLFLLKLEGLTLSTFVSVIIALAAFIIFVKPGAKIIRVPIGAAPEASARYVNTIKEATAERLRAFENIFQSLSGLFMDNKIQKGLEKSHITRLIDEITLQTCAVCKKSDECWRDNFYDTYRDFVALLKKCDEDGKVSQSDMPYEMKTKCIDKNSLINCINSQLEAHKLETACQNRLKEAKSLVNLQLFGAAEMIKSVSDELSNEFLFLYEEEAKIRLLLEKRKLAPNDVVVYKKRTAGQGSGLSGTFVDITLTPCKKNFQCEYYIIPIVEEVLNLKMKRLDNDCNICTTQNGIRQCRLSLCQKESFRVNYGYAMAKKSSSKISGDSFSFLNIPKGGFLMALSDGMGTGEKARAQSQKAIELLEEFSQTSFNMDMAVKMINSALYLNSDSETFSTLDIAVIGLENGIAEFSKVGASSSFIITNEGVKTIESSSLPVGILSDITMETAKHKLNDGDFLIMTTDGVMDAISNFYFKERWILEMFEKANTQNPQEIAAFIVEGAKKASCGKVRDDMTVLCMRIQQY